MIDLITGLETMTVKSLERSQPPGARPDRHAWNGDERGVERARRAAIAGEVGFD